MRSLLFAVTLSCLQKWWWWWRVISIKAPGRSKDSKPGSLLCVHDIFCFVRKRIVSNSTASSKIHHCASWPMGSSLSVYTALCCYHFLNIQEADTGMHRHSFWSMISLRSPDDDFIRRAFPTSLRTGEVWERKGFGGSKCW